MDKKLKYDLIDDYYEGRAIVKLNGKYGFIDLNGVEVTVSYYFFVNLFFQSVIF
jgi:hypothetical protein